MSDKTILVFGATGQQGGAVARHLLRHGWNVRAVTRNPEGEAAQALRDAGAEIVQANLDDPATLASAMEGVHGVFSVQNTWTDGVEGEIRQGKAVADAAKAAGVQHFLYTSVGGAERNTGIPHFESKWEVEQHIRLLQLPATVIRPVFFFDNLNVMAQPAEEGTGKVLPMGMHPERPLQMIAVDDIGAFAAVAFNNPEEYIGREIELAGDEITIPQLAQKYAAITGEPLHFVPLTVDQVKAYNEDMGAMFEWFNSSGYTAKIEDLRKVHPELKDAESWLRSR
ncbi:MAG: NmrA/HSCARG family protein [Chlorobi bacterium]|nr:MAG: NAD(P)H azoreductase [Chlorobi bacterium OLB7]MBK8911335.1 NmrA/HSCARG family protein [Chlorobiota bacterium]